MVENRRVGIKSRETYECPASLALILAHADLESIYPRARPGPREGTARAPLRRARSTTACGSPAASRRSTPSSTRASATSPARCACASSPARASVTGRRSPHSLYDYGLATYDAADTLPPRGLAPASCACGASASRPGRPARARRRAGRRRRATAADEHAVARAVRGRPGRRAAGLHRQPRRSTGGWPPTTSPARGPTCAGLVRAGILDRRRGRRRARPPSTGSRTSWPTGTFAFAPTDEDIHTAVERRVTELAGPAGAKLHTGRSRNDQVATDLRLYTKRELADVAGRVLDAAAGAARPGRRGRRRLPARLHPPAAGPAGAAGPPPAGPRLGAGPRRRPPARRPRAGSTCRRSAPARWPARRCRSTPTAPPTTSASPPRFENSPRRRERPRLRGRGAVRPRPARRPPVAHRRGGRAVVDRRVRLPPPRRRLRHRLARCCRRRRTPTSPSWPGARPAGSSATSPACWPR